MASVTWIHRENNLNGRRKTAMLALTTLLLAFVAIALPIASPPPAQAAGSRTLNDVYGVSRSEIVSWLEAHEDDAYYLGTPYRPFDWRSPNGDVNGTGTNSDGLSAGMNCTGFVWHALCAAHGWNDDIGKRMPAMKGWAVAIRDENLENYTFTTKEDMLASGVLEKGDIIWMWDGVIGQTSNFNHIGIFWGNSSDEDLIWHSSGEYNAGAWSGTNEIGPIHGKSNVVVYQVVKTGGVLQGGISLQKHSALPALTNGNACYRLSGAEYGLFESDGAAQTHDAGTALRTFLTNEEGYFESELNIPVGTYYVTEISAPAGYTLDLSVYEVAVASGKTTRVNGEAGVKDTPVSNPVTLWAAKRDAESADGKAQGAATLEGTLFEISYYDGYYTLATLPASAERSWVVATGADGCALVSDELKMSGDDFYRTASGQITLPLGTVTVREYQAPHGYLLDNSTGAPEIQVIQLTNGMQGDTIAVFTAPTATDLVKRGGVAVGKMDRQFREYLPQGASTLADATFAIATSNSQPVFVEGVWYTTGEVVKIIESHREADGRFIARTSEHCLPAGYYTVYECESGEGYCYDDTSKAWKRDFEICEDGQMVDLSAPENAAQNRVIRGDFSFSKVGEGGSSRLAHVPFKVESKTTGEWHIVVTDENGMISTASDWNAHTCKTNANDAAFGELSGRPVVDETKLDPSAGVWFNGHNNATCTPDDSYGALPYDSYIVTELPAHANESLELVSFTVRVSREAYLLDLGTIEDRASPLVGTSLSDENGVKLAPANTHTTVYDTVNYVNLDSTRTYEVKGEMHLVTTDGADGGVLSQGSTKFQPQAAGGSVEVTFDLDTHNLGGQRLVAFERVFDDAGTQVATHEDLLFEGQTVRVPELSTTLTAQEGNDKDTLTEGMFKLADTVEYHGLTPGDTYTLEGTLHLRGEDGSDAGVATDASGAPIIARKNFTATKSEGSEVMLFEFEAPALAGHTVVAFEELSRRGQPYATHADIGDAKQTAVLGAPPTIPVVTEVPPAPIESSTTNALPAKLPSTGDTLSPLPLLLIACAALGLAVALVCGHVSKRRPTLSIDRGPSTPDKSDKGDSLQ